MNTFYKDGFDNAQTFDTTTALDGIIYRDYLHHLLTFSEIKLFLKLLLTYFDPTQKIVVIVNALNHCVQELRKLSCIQQVPDTHFCNYSQVEKEILALTNYKLLLPIFGSKKWIPVYSAS